MNYLNSKVMFKIIFYKRNLTVILQVILHDNCLKINALFEYIPF